MMWNWRTFVFNSKRVRYSTFSSNTNHCSEANPLKEQKNPNLKEIGGGRELGIEEENGNWESEEEEKGSVKRTEEKREE